MPSPADTGNNIFTAVVVSPVVCLVLLAFIVNRILAREARVRGKAKTEGKKGRFAAEPPRRDRKTEHEAWWRDEYYSSEIRGGREGAVDRMREVVRGF
ncbi:hypothetical protein MMC21_003937 [Puttea exsequens]|nr:hypothetical protein [Puttea exsequens]